MRMIFNKSSHIRENIHKRYRQFQNGKKISPSNKMWPKCETKHIHLHILHRLLITKRKLIIFNTIEDDFCNDCGQCETVLNMLYDCNQV